MIFGPSLSEEKPLEYAEYIHGKNNGRHKKGRGAASCKLLVKLIPTPSAIVSNRGQVNNCHL